jgi:hypothetical protein
MERPPLTYTIGEVMSALDKAFPSPRTSRDCAIEKNFQDALAHRTCPSYPEEEQRKRVASDEDNGG